MFKRIMSAAVLSSCAACASHPAPQSATIPPQVSVPLIFERNAGQTADEYDYLAHTTTYDAAFHARGVTFALKNSADDDASIVALEFPGARAIRPTAQAPLAGRVNYLRGSSAHDPDSNS